jgi:hypothetical protein
MLRLSKIYLIIIVLAVSLVVLSGCSSIQSFFQNPKYMYDNGAVLVDGSDNPIELQNDPAAVNVTFADLLDFIRRDPTDQIQYVDRHTDDGLRPFVCADFAEAVHNNAEAAGIRAGYASIDWLDSDVGHAIDVFETTDEGLVYIDCTGPGRYSQVEDGQTPAPLKSWDKVAYLKIGLEYGVIGIDYALSPDYTFYTQYSLQWQDLKRQLADYNADVKLYNQEIAGKVFKTGSLEYARIKAWEAELDVKEKAINDLRASVGTSRFKPLGVVKSFNIHW